MYRKKLKFLSQDALVRKSCVRRQRYSFFSDFSGDVLGFRIDLEEFAELVRQHASHHGFFKKITYDVMRVA